MLTYFRRFRKQKRALAEKLILQSCSFSGMGTVFVKFYEVATFRGRSCLYIVLANIPSPLSADFFYRALSLSTASCHSCLLRDPAPLCVNGQKQGGAGRKKDTPIGRLNPGNLLPAGWRTICAEDHMKKRATCSSDLFSFEKMQNLEAAPARRWEELLRARRRLEELFELSREVGTKANLSELVRFLLDITLRLLPGSAPAFLLLDPSGEQLLRIED